MTHDVRRDVMIMNVLAEPREENDMHYSLPSQNLTTQQHGNILHITHLLCWHYSCFFVCVWGGGGGAGVIAVAKV